MANYANLIALVNDAIKTNGIQAITGQLLQTVLGEIIGSLGTGYQFAGLASPGSVASSVDSKIFLFASEAGEYNNFHDSYGNPIELAEGELAILANGTYWTKYVIATMPVSSLAISTDVPDLGYDEADPQTIADQMGQSIADVLATGAVRFVGDVTVGYYKAIGYYGEEGGYITFIGTDKVYQYDVNADGYITGEKETSLAPDDALSDTSENAVKNKVVKAAFDAMDEAKQDVLTFDDVPTENSNNPVKSGGVYAAIASVNSKIASGYIFGGVATPSSTPNLSVGKICYLANSEGIYTNYGGLSLYDNECSILLYDGANWSKTVITANVNTQIYGVRHYYNNASPDLTRIGNMDCHRTLPVQSLMRRCVVRDDGTVNYYLDDNDSTKKADDTPAVLDGTDGQVMVDIPPHFRKCSLNATAGYMDVEISLFPFAGAVEIPRYLVSAYEATLDRTNNKLSSVVNTTAQYRGGNNNSAWDGTYRDLRGLPATNISLTNFRTYGRNRGAKWGCYDYNAHLDIFWLFAIEYATLNSQKTFNATLTADGYRQGGLGPGVSTFSNWDNYNSYNPIIPCGFTNSLGNKTGVVTFTLNAEQAEVYGSAHSESVPSYRGIENPFGHIWKWTDGFLGVGNGEYQEVYVCRDPEKYSSSVTADYTDIGHESSSNGYCKAIIASDSALDQAIRVYGDIFDRDDSGSASTFFCDYHYHANADGTTYGLLVGGDTSSGSHDGLACLHAAGMPSYAVALIGSRLCFYIN